MILEGGEGNYLAFPPLPPINVTHIYSDIPRSSLPPPLDPRSFETRPPPQLPPLFNLRAAFDEGAADLISFVSREKDNIMLFS